MFITHDEIINKIVESFAQTLKFKETTVEEYIKIARYQPWGGTTPYTGWLYQWTSEGLRICHLVNGEWEEYMITPKQFKERSTQPKQLSFNDL